MTSGMMLSNDQTQGYPLVNSPNHIDPGSHRGLIFFWKASFHQNIVIFRVYVQFLRGTLW